MQIYEIRKRGTDGTSGTGGIASIWSETFSILAE